MDNILIIGTSHIAEQSIREIKQGFDRFKPEIVAIELDLERARALAKEDSNRIGIMAAVQIGFKGYLFAKVGQMAQRKLGKTVGVSPGSEMRTAMQLASEAHLQVAFIDQPIRVTLRNFSSSITWKEKYHFFVDILSALLFPRRQMRRLGVSKLDLRKVPSPAIVEKLLLELRGRYPNVYRTLVEDRNKYMLRQIVKIQRLHPQKKILVVVGAGHKKDIEEMLLKVDVV